MLVVGAPLAALAENEWGTGIQDSLSPPYKNINYVSSAEVT